MASPTAKLSLTGIWKNTRLSAYTNAVNLGVNFLLVVLLARWLGAAQLGQYAFAVALVGLVFGLANFGIQTILTREIAKDNAVTAKYLSNSLGIRFLVSLPLGVIASVIVAVLTQTEKEVIGLVLIAGVYVGLAGIATVFFGALQGCDKFREQFLLNSIYKIASLVGCAAIVAFGGGVSEILILFTVLQAAVVLVAWRYVNREICKVSIRLDKNFALNLVRRSFPLSLSSTAEYINLKSDSVLIGAMKNVQDVGIYSAATNVYMGMVALPYSLITAYFPAFSKSFSTEKDQSRQLFSRMLSLLFFGAVAMAAIVAAMSSVVIEIIYPAEFAQASLALTILCIGFPFLILNRFANLSLISMGQERYVFYITLVGAVINVTLNIIYIPQYSYVGASATTVVTEFLVMVVGLVRVKAIFRRSSCDVAAERS